MLKAHSAPAVLLSALVERFYVSCMQDLLACFGTPNHESFVGELPFYIKIYKD